MVKNNPRKMKANSKVFLPIARFLLILLFTYTGISKMLGHEQFAAQLSLQPKFRPLLLYFPGYCLLLNSLQFCFYYLSGNNLSDSCPPPF